MVSSVLKDASEYPPAVIADVALRTQLADPKTARGLYRTAALLVLCARALVAAGDDSLAEPFEDDEEGGPS